MKTILLSGPNPGNKGGSYGGGQGGYTRNVNQYLDTFRAQDIKLELCPTSIRQSGRFHFLKFPMRLIADALNVIKQSRDAYGIHILAQYRSAIYREYIIVVICNYLKIPVLYDIKAGVFIEWFERCNILQKGMINYVLKSSRQIFCEGTRYVEFLHDMGYKPTYFPNFIQLDEYVERDYERLQTTPIKCLFTGYCYHGKGVFELIEGLNTASLRGLSIELTIVGEESPEFHLWLNRFPVNDSAFQISRRGKMLHTEVMNEMAVHDVFIMPSEHCGEGHNNSINEAMLMGMVIVSTKNGFLGTVLNDECAYWVEPLSVSGIADKMIEIDKNRNEARLRASKAKYRVEEMFSDRGALEKMQVAYKSLIKRK